MVAAALCYSAEASCAGAEGGRGEDGGVADGDADRSGASGDAAAADEGSREQAVVGAYSDGVHTSVGQA